MADVWGLVAANLAAIWWHRLSIEDRQSCDLVAVSINRRSAAGDQRVTATQRGVVRVAGWRKGTCIVCSAYLHFPSLYFYCVLHMVLHALRHLHGFEAVHMVVYLCT